MKQNFLKKFYHNRKSSRFSVPKNPFMDFFGNQDFKIMNDLDYVRMYAEKLKNDKKLFTQQKNLIESQLHRSSDIFRKRFGIDKQFKKNARIYLKGIGIISSE